MNTSPDPNNPNQQAHSRINNAMNNAHQNIQRASVIKLFLILGTPLILALLALTVSGFWIAQTKMNTDKSGADEDLVEETIEEAPEAVAIAEPKQEVINPFDLDFNYIPDYGMPTELHPESPAAKCWVEYKVNSCFELSNEEPAPVVVPEPTQSQQFPRYDQLNPGYRADKPTPQTEPNRGSGRRNLCNNKRCNDGRWHSSRSNYPNDISDTLLDSPVVIVGVIGLGAYLASRS